MPPIQNTFTIIPDAPSAFNTNHHGNHNSAGTRPSRPPMTTKQVKKAYQKANKGPKLSKAEKRRQELFEQDRIRKEFEKEKNQARARAARDRKKEKEERERAEKKKKGLPLVDVRASQDTIARFVRAKPKTQKNCSASPLPVAGLQRGETESRSVTPTHDVPGSSSRTRRFDDTNKENVRPPEQFEKGSPLVSVVVTDNDRGLVGESPVRVPAEPPNKKRRIGVLDEKEEDGTPFLIASGVASPSSKSNRKVSITGEHIEGISPVNVEQDGLDIDDSFSTIDFSEEDLLDDLLRKTESVHGTPNTPHKMIPGQQQGQNPPTEFPPPKPPDYKNRVPSPKGSPPYLERTAMPTKSLLPPHQAVTQPEPIPDIEKTPRQNSIPEQAEQVSTPHSVIVPPASGVQKSQPIAPSSRSFRHPRSPMLPPPIPPKFKSSKVSASHPRTPQFLKHPPPITTGSSCHSRMTKPKEARENQLPPSTQLFILSHFDDFLPTPSQEIREIFGEPKRKHAGNNNQAELKATHASRKTLRSNSHISKVPATSYSRSMVSTPDTTPRGPRHIQQTANYTEPRKPVPRPSIQPIPETMACTFEMPFFSTQDLFLSSQDVKDIEEDPMPPPKAQAPIPIPSKDCSKRQILPQPSPKQFFNKSCRETQYKYIIERNRTAAWEGPEAQQKAREELDRFQAAEDDLLQALLANPDEGEEDKRGAIAVENCAAKLEITRRESLVTQLHSTPTPQLQPSRITHIDSLDRSARDAMSSSGPILRDAAQTHTCKPPDVQRSRPDTSSSGKPQRSTRPKGSYEAMLELLAKRPIPPGRGSSPPNGDRGDGTRCTERNQTTTKESHATAATIPASQETDYDCGEEWDDDDLLCDML
ncbi:hypothetical protein GGR58DRAFT_455359 [Xylaria digitata]|nr:hypothetical protein GGR58DRAFT_455359 [Xylaria digitata]